MKHSAPPATLAHQLVTAEGATPARFLLFLHGVFGMGTNFRALAKAIVAQVPSVGVVLVDLRAHGGSQGFAPPHDLRAAAADLEALCQALAARGQRVVGVIGHSFGGKVALAFAASHPLELLVVLDSQPGPRDAAAENDSAANVLAILESLDHAWPAREAFAQALAERGLAAPVVAWLTMNLRRDGDEYRLRLDLPAIRAMLSDYFARDLFGVLADPSRAAQVGVVVGGRSTVLDAAARARLAQLAQSRPGLRVTELASAGHWVHVDDPGGVVEFVVDLLRSQLPTGGVLR